MEKMATSTEKTGDALKVTQKQMEQTNVSSVKVSTSLKSTESSASKAAKTFIKFNVVAKVFKSLLKEGIEAVVEMDKALTDMSIVTGKSREELQSMIPQFNALGRATGATSTEVAGLTAEYMKQGRTMKDSMELAEQTAKAAKISGISTADSIEYMTSAINGFNLAAKDAEHVSDVFAKLGAASATDYKDLAIALSKVSAQANTAGMSMEFTTTLLAKGLEVTQEAPESIGTALKTVLARMRELSDYGSTLEDNTSVNKVENALKAVGIELRDTNGQFRDMEEIFNELGPQWDSLNTMQQQAIAQAVAGTRQQSRFLAIMQDWDRTIELSNAALDAEGATMYQHTQYAESLEFSINKLQTAWQGFIAGMTDSNLIRDAFSFIADVVSGVVGVIDKLNEISDGFLGTATTLTAVGWVLVSIIKERVQAHREETELRKQQLEQIRQQTTQQGIALGQQQAQTNQLREQVALQQQLNSETGQYKTFWENIGGGIRGAWDSVKGFGQDFAASWKEGWQAGTSATQEGRLNKIKKIQNRLNKDQNMSEKKRNKLTKK
jgi:TP901 family phage tail tape measure protein